MLPTSNFTMSGQATLLSPGELRRVRCLGQGLGLDTSSWGRKDPAIPFHQGLNSDHALWSESCPVALMSLLSFLLPGEPRRELLSGPHFHSLFMDLSRLQI